ncbi:transporter [Candidatus Pacearchaeota archaeon]|nr:MAG: transporter [Candidatus Pacearchaeota archaeon]
MEGDKLTILSLLFVCVIFAIVGQLFMKKGMVNTGEINIRELFSLKLLSVLFEKYVFIGLVAYVIGTMLWLVVLSKADLSYAYPILATSYIFIAILSWRFFGEFLSLYRMLGIMLIMIGVILLNLKLK